jgi:hypothetical protein
LKQCHHQMHISGLDCLHGRCSPWKDTHKVYDAVSQFWKSPDIELWCYMKASKSCVFSGMSLYEAFGLTSSVFFFFFLIINLQLHVMEDALVNFKSELAVMELEIQVNSGLFEQLSRFLNLPFFIWEISPFSSPEAYWRTAMFYYHV